jgi:predicted double-glycine peptidase
MLALLALMLSLAPRPAVESTTPVVPELRVPFVGQTDALCAGASIAMVLRYWGDRHADPQQFAGLINRRDGGIEATNLVRAVIDRGWQVTQLRGSLDLLGAMIDGGLPVVVLLGERRDHYHYLVVVAVNDRHVIVHDPAWGPSRPIGTQEFLRRWERSNFWMVDITPADRVARPEPARHTREVTPAHDAPPRTPENEAETACQLRLAGAIDASQTQSLGATAELLEGVRWACPIDAAPLRELAGVRFALGEWTEAARLARRSLERDPQSDYAWDVLGSSQFVAGDVIDALAAWNHIDRPRIDLVRIDGLRRQRYQAIANFLDLQPNAVLTAARYRLAERRLNEVPGAAASRLSLQPGSDGYTSVAVGINERTGLPRAPFDALAAGARAAVDREVAVTLPVTTGQGEAWTGRWRWEENRPRVSLNFAAPRRGPIRGIWEVDATWETESFRPASTQAGPNIVRDSRAHGGLTIADWITPGLRYTLSAGVDRWRGAVDRRAISFGGGVERRWLGDRLTSRATHTRWSALDDPNRGFHETVARIDFRSSASPDGLMFLAVAGANRVSEGSPLGLWASAGEGRLSDALLRAHPALADGIANITGSSAFGRSLDFTSVEVQRWTRPAGPVALALAGFADLAHVGQTSDATGRPVLLDAGTGLRVHLPGAQGAFRVDVARGLRDGARAITVGWQSTVNSGRQ